MKPSTYSNDEYTIGWVSALSEEFKVAMAMLDEEHGRPQSAPREDSNVYHLGRIGEHNVVMACLSGGQMGTGPAAIVAENMRRTFKSIRFALLVGIGGCVPDKKKDIRLGDVVVSYPSGIYTGVVQYDYGKLKGDGNVQRKDWFSPPPSKVLSAVTALEAYHTRPKNQINQMLGFIDELGEDYAYPEASETPDHLYQADYVHISEAETCDSCNPQALVHRKTRNSPCKPRVHYGIVASGNMVMKNGIERQRIDQRYENSLLCFEMEAAGMMNNFSCLVIRGISDYSDSHKNDQWRNRAIAVASAYAKELLSLIEPSDMEVLPPLAARALDTVSRKLEDINEQTTANTELIKQNTMETQRRKEQDLQFQFEAWLKPPNVREIQQDQFRKKLPGTCNWIWSNPIFRAWNGAPLSSATDRIICIHGPPGSGKSILASDIVDRMWNDNVPALFFAFSSMHASQQKSSGLIRSLLWQLVKIVLRKQEQDTSILSTLMLRGQPTTSDLWMGLSEMATFVSEPVYGIIDGVDEISDPVPELLQRLLVFLETNSNFRFILLGRQHAFHKTDSIHHKIEISPALTKDDVDRVIETNIERSAILNKPALRNEVLSSLQEQSDGNFLWVKLMFGQLEKSLPLAHGLKRLKRLPRDLESVYEELLLGIAKNLEEDEMSLARKLFAFIVVSQRPLSMAEVQHLLAVDALSTSSGERLSIQDCLIPQLDQRILDLCGDLIDIRNGCLQLVHFSVKEFLTRPKERWARHGKRRRTREFRVSPEDAHRWLASACMEYIEKCVDASFMNDRENLSQFDRQHPFLLYSSTYMHIHLHQSGSPTNSFLNDIRSFLKSNRWIAGLEILFLNLFDDDALFSQYEEAEKLVLWLGDEKNEISEQASASLKVVHERRAREFGPNDPRTERLSLFLHYLEHISVPTLVEASASCAIQSTAPSADLQPIMEIVRRNEPLSLQLKANLMLRMVMHLQKFKRLTDPLQVLFQKILQHGSSMPLYVLLFVGQFCEKNRRYELAIEFYFLALSKAEEKEGRVKFSLLFFIGRTYFRLEKYEKALEYFKDAMTGLEKILGPEHEDALETISSVAFTLQWLGQYRSSLEFYHEALPRLEKKFGLEHKSTLRTLDSICMCYEGLDQLPDALMFCKKALVVREKSLGLEHEDTVLNFYDLGYFYLELEQYTDGLECFTKALLNAEKIVGFKQEDIWEIMNNISEAYRLQGQFSDSLELQKKIFLVQGKALGPEHEETLYTLYRISRDYCDLERYTEGLEHLMKALSGQDKVLGLEHDDTLKTIHQIGWTYGVLEKYADALEFFQKGLGVEGRLFGFEDEDTLETLSWIGWCYLKLQQYTNALESFEKALLGRQKIFGPDDEHTLFIMKDIGATYEKLGRYEDALLILEKALAGLEKIFAPEDEEYLSGILELIGTVYSNLEKHPCALKFFERAVTEQEKAIESDDEDIRRLHELIEKEKKTIAWETGIECDPQF
ncbi:unnamed protein product [Penicillium pancosmium]